MNWLRHQIHIRRRKQDGSLYAVTASAAASNGSCNNVSITPKVTVQILDGLSQNQDLTLHCKSKDDDLGVHTIKKKKATYEFTFRPRYFIHSTQFFCSFWWPSNTSLHCFDIYMQDRDWCCAVCFWTIWESGPCISDDLTGYIDCYPWNSV
ncbi:S-protein homolog 29-like [Prosopis cineraria]|uniref:S-protein homolog 29-like n=1 Tax=Prosopis cineraria TaxID=364024 RepID=UPI0024103E2A|nr:S-protein homolog 29-like [Prosopis cineraria]